MIDAIPSPIQALLALFDGELASVKFPDVDAALLASSAANVRASAEAVARAEAALDAARASLVETNDALVVRAQRALAYARVYAEGNASLGTQLDAITLPRAARRSVRDGESLGNAGAHVAPARRRGRSRKDESSGSLLDAQPSAD
jgi:ElaB/YqjD/DUF883 family membrane-anchored ribosome-binding protein